MSYYYLKFYTLLLLLIFLPNRSHAVPACDHLLGLLSDSRESETKLGFSIHTDQELEEIRKNLHKFDVAIEQELMPPPELEKGKDLEKERLDARFERYMKNRIALFTTTDPSGGIGVLFGHFDSKEKGKYVAPIFDDKDESSKTRLETLRNLLGLKSSFWGTKWRHIEKVKWDSLSFEQKLRLLEIAGRWNPKQWENSIRGIPGLTISDRAVIDTEGKSITIMGKTYEPDQSGRVTLSGLRSFLNPNQLEYTSQRRSPWSIELHVRKQGSVAEISESTFDLFRHLDDLEEIKFSRQHIHLLGELPEGFLEQNPGIGPLALTYSHIRKNLIVEINTLFNGHKLIERSKTYHFGGKETVLWFAGYLNLSQVGKLFSYFEHFIFKRSDPDFISGLKTDLKISSVGLRTNEYYEQIPDVTLIGSEIRRVRTGTESPRSAAILNGFQWMMASPTRGISVDRIQRWYDIYGANRSPEKMMQLLLYDFDLQRRSHGVITEMASPKVQEFLKSNPEFARIYINLTSSRRVETHGRQTKMLLHNWTNDILFFDDPEAKERIEQAQLQAFKNIFRFWEARGGETKIDDIQDKILEETSAFFHYSGIFERLLDSSYVRKFEGIDDFASDESKLAELRSSWEKNSYFQKRKSRSSVLSSNVSGRWLSDFYAEVGVHLKQKEREGIFLLRKEGVRNVLIRYRISQNPDFETQLECLLKTWP